MGDHVRSMVWHVKGTGNSEKFTRVSSKPRYAFGCYPQYSLVSEPGPCLLGIFKQRSDTLPRERWGPIVTSETWQWKDPIYSVVGTCQHTAEHGSRSSSTSFSASPNHLHAYKVQIPYPITPSPPSTLSAFAPFSVLPYPQYTYIPILPTHYILL